MFAKFIYGFANLIVSLVTDLGSIIMYLQFWMVIERWQIFFQNKINDYVYI